MSRKLNIVLGALLALLAVAALAACGGGSTTTGEVAQSGKSGSTESTEGTEAKPESTEGAAGEAPAEKEEQPSEETAPESESGSREGESEGQGGSGESSAPESSEEGQKSESGKSGESKKQQSEEPAVSGKKGIRAFGSEAGAAETEAASRVVGRYLTAVRKEDWSTACSTLAKQVVGTIERAAEANPEFKGKNCAGVLTAAAKMNSKPQLGPPLKGSLDALRLKGSKGYALYNGESLAMPVSKEGGNWKVNAFEPLTLSS